MEGGFEFHLGSGDTSVCRCWRVTRRDGTVHGFTDHDGDLVIDGLRYRADTGMSAGVLQSSTGLSVDNSEAVGALSDLAITEADIEAGRFDGAEVLALLVNWADPKQRQVQFRGTIGEIRRGGGAFHAELRGLTEVLNRPVGRVFQAACSAVLGDAACRVDIGDPSVSVEAVVTAQSGRSLFTLSGAESFASGWFERGSFEVLDGEAYGIFGMIKSDVLEDGARAVRLWQPVPAPIETGARVRLIAGCDKRAETCRAKFGNFLNFRGFPHIPGDDWLMSYPGSGAMDGGALIQ
ncbi:DUF2163 domain-containing protein [Anianabacter salinae]|uniref:DUF2163 domain-containing protein n=1 Tax=Anianabacter salinae TaxID=2851023 RepID=UPI00225E385E|nr:DUF2163 domain-containing protein [Anianabacter salinae]MBV0912951.1 DUF2163 domain-containing protein [Anianabacter salinae]